MTITMIRMIKKIEIPITTRAVVEIQSELFY
jgi:hypothetical protein